MSDIKPPFESVEDRLVRAEAALAALSRGDVDLFIGPKEPLVVRLKSLVEQKERQDRLLETLIETSPALILMTDSKGLIVRFNQACEIMSGYTRDEVVGRTIPEMFKAAGWADVLSASIADPIDSTLINPDTISWFTKEGQKRLIEWRCVAVASPEGDGRYVLGIGLDITMRKLAQDAATEARRFAESIVATVREPLLVLDDGLRVKSANRSFYQTFHVKPVEIINSPLHELGDGQWEAPGLRNLLEAVLHRNSTFDNFEVRHEFPRVGQRIMMLNARRVFTEKGKTTMILLAIDDVTDKVRAQEELHKLNRELEDRVRERTTELKAANKELEAFCYSVSHDLRAPLRALDGFSQQLLRSYAHSIDETGLHYLRRVRAGTQRMGQLIDDLLGLSKVTRAKMHLQRVDLAVIAMAVVADLQEREPERTISFKIGSGLIAQSDPRLMRVVLENLLGNAWKYSSKKRTATIEFDRSEVGGRQTFVVRDNGAGFDMAFADKIFEAFQRLHTEREFPGTGIGLATVQRIVHRHGGEIWAEGEVGRGAAFYFTLPGMEKST